MKFLLLTSLFLLSGCSSNPKFSFDFQTRRVTIITEPEGANITQINPVGAPSFLGTSPIEDRSVVIVYKVKEVKNLSYQTIKSLMEQVGNVVVQVSKDGYETYRGTLKTDPEKTTVHEIKLQPKKSTYKKDTKKVQSCNAGFVYF